MRTVCQNVIHFETTPEYDALPAVEKDATTYSDLYKDVYGVRPSLEGFRALTDEQRQDQIGSLSKQLEIEMRTEKSYRAEQRNADRVDGYDRDDIGESPDF